MARLLGAPLQFLGRRRTPPCVAHPWAGCVSVGPCGALEEGEWVCRTRRAGVPAWAVPVTAATDAAPRYTSRLVENDPRKSTNSWTVPTAPQCCRSTLCDVEAGTWVQSIAQSGMTPRAVLTTVKYAAPAAFFSRRIIRGSRRAGVGAWECRRALLRYMLAGHGVGSQWPRTEPEVSSVAREPGDQARDPQFARRRGGTLQSAKNLKGARRALRRE